MSMKKIKIFILICLCVIEWDINLFSQIQLVWIDTIIYQTDGDVRGIYPDQDGRLFVNVSTQDTFCDYSMVRVLCYDAIGLPVIDTAINNDSTCISEDVITGFYSDSVFWLSYQDTMGYMIRLESGGASTFFTSDNYSLFGEYEWSSGEIFGFVPQRSTVVKYSTAGSVIAEDSLDYNMPCSIRNIEVSSDGSIFTIFNTQDVLSNDMLGVGVRVDDIQLNLIGDTIINPQTAPSDCDIYKDSELTSGNSLLLLTTDLNSGGIFLYKIDNMGNVVASYSRLGIVASQVVYDNIHSLVYVNARETTRNVIFVLDSSLNLLDSIEHFTQLAWPSLVSVTTTGLLCNYLFWQQSTQKALKLYIYDHLQTKLDSFQFWDSTLYTSLFPGHISIDSSGLIYLNAEGQNSNGNEISMFYCLNSPVGLAETAQFARTVLTVHPNPANTSVTATFDTQGLKEFSIYSLDGRLLLSSVTYSEQAVIDVCSLSSGTYLIRCTSESNIQSSKIFVKH
jgi:hypothetical protein